MSVTQIRGNTQIIDNTISNAKILDATLTDAKISSSAAISYSKLSLSNSIVNADINSSAAIAYSKLNLSASIVNADISATAAIVYSKLSLANSIVNADISASAAIATSKLADGAEFLKRDGSVPLTGDLNANTHKITNVVDPVAAQDAATKAYVDSVASGLTLKNPSRAATAAALPSVTYNNGTSGVGATLTATANGALPAQDGVTLVVNDRLLVKDQVAALQNGIYVVTAVGDVSNPFVLTRAADVDGSPSNEVVDGIFTFINEGTTQADTGWVVTTNNPITVGTSAITWVQFSAAGVILAGAGLTKTGNTIDVVSGDASLVVNADELHVQRDAAGAIGLSGSGLIVNVDGVTLDISGNNLEVKTGGITNTQVSASAGIVYSKLSLGNSIVNSDISSSAAIAYSKLNLSASIVNADISATAAIAFSKLAPLTSAHILVGDGSNVATDVAVTGDLTLANTGTFTITSTALGSSGHFVTREVPTGAINSSNTTFTLASTPVTGSEEVFLNGVLQNVGAGNDYTISSGTITFNTAPLTGDVLLVSYRK